MNPGSAKAEAALRFERIFVTLILDLLEKRHLSVPAFAQDAFPKEYRSDPVRRFRAMVTQGKLGKPQRITLADAYLIAEALEIDLPYLILMARQKMLNQAPNHDAQEL